MMNEKRRSVLMLVLLCAAFVSAAACSALIPTSEHFCIVRVSHNGGPYVLERQLIPTAQVLFWLVGVVIAAVSDVAMAGGAILRRTRTVSIVALVFILLSACYMGAWLVVWGNDELISTALLAFLPLALSFISAVLGCMMKGSSGHSGK